MSKRKKIQRDLGLVSDLLIGNHGSLTTHIIFHSLLTLGFCDVSRVAVGKVEEEIVLDDANFGISWRMIGIGLGYRI
ncbi:hypothetical protein VNO77_42592 [Canavalia gladiata]|uniref:Uncharacterized protein n=1 Tax=Canavalia gladiata TaxID=3824 RepID=A0AAN9JUR8_CANGL